MSWKVTPKVTPVFMLLGELRKSRLVTTPMRLEGITYHVSKSDLPLARPIAHEEAQLLRLD
jgi:hypothetical protein